VLVIVQSDNGLTTSLVNVICVTLPVPVVPDQTTMIAVDVLNQDYYKITTVLIHVPNKEPIQMKLTEYVPTVTIPVKNVLVHPTLNVLSVTPETGCTNSFKALTKVCV
jgi:hypothetical protein